MRPNEQAQNRRDTYKWWERRSKLEPSPIDLGTYQGWVNVLYQNGPAIDPQAVSSYRAMARECIEQFAWMLKHGVHVTFHDTDPTPMATGKDGTQYPSIKLLMQEFESTGELRIYRSPDGFHPLLDMHSVQHNGREENANSIFRAVHDYFGHLASGGYFNWTGETQAYYSHASMFSDAARPALFCDSVAQQCVYAATGDYADQKCIRFGPEWFSPPLG
jgi:hypothetical protein